MYTLVISVHILLAMLLVGLVLLQQGKGADAGALMSGGSQSVFGVGGATSVIVKITTGIALLFMMTSVLLVKLAASGVGPAASTVSPLEGSLMQDMPVQDGTQAAPVEEAAPAGESEQPASAPAVADSAANAPVDSEQK